MALASYNQIITCNLTPHILIKNMAAEHERHNTKHARPSKGNRPWSISIKTEISLYVSKQTLILIKIASRKQNHITQRELTST